MTTTDKKQKTINPYSTEGARNAWFRGYNGQPINQYLDEEYKYKRGQEARAQDAANGLIEPAPPMPEGPKETLPPKLPVTGKYSVKPYQCDRCGHESEHGTNHWGQIYNLRCNGCSWKNPTEPFVTMSCTEPVPDGYGIPTPWKTYRLGDICEIIEVNTTKGAK